MVSNSVNIEKEYYFALLMDRAHQGPVMVASPAGGMDIEAVAEETPELIFTDPIDIMEGMSQKQADAMAAKLGFEGDNQARASEQMLRLYDLFVGTDATQVEINPLAELDNGEVMCCDAKINFDDNAFFRQQDIFEMRDFNEEDPREVEAAKNDLNYVGLDGNIGCMVNGAGLAMATMDIIQMYGGMPANFLDVGGGATEGQVTEAFKILTNDKNVKGILVNIFGGIVQCNVIADGIVNAAKTVNLQVPLTVRLEGTNVEQGKEILKNSGLPIITADNLDEAAKKSVASIQ
eukprot:TRINITY_DN1121_c0_g1_i2.p2 TRINITY_DN1121_c0_g1~~TRINITY_DN1121_c0_g1_i2.p2  ORF type:complete len:291 (+),score=135.60 TRINITY_DN1121_c0_g1_i2:633-1505(+)